MFGLFSAKLDGVKTYMRMRRVPNHLQVKVIKWFDYLWLTQKCSDEEKAVSCLPGKIPQNYSSTFLFTNNFDYPLNLITLQKIFNNSTFTQIIILSSISSNIKAPYHKKNPILCCL